jgi:EmrB/QacA subfamily drug resistance transporter
MASAASPCMPSRVTRAVAVFVCCLTIFVIAVDTTVVNLALPLIGRDLHASVGELQWTVAAYTITAASLMLTSGSVGDRFGRRTVLQAGLAVFTLASAGCGLAPSAGWLIAFRAVQGAAGSALTPMAMGILTAMFADPRARARVLGVWSGTFGIGMAVGPVVGGALAATWGWRSLFWINVVPGLAGIVLSMLVIGESRAARPRRVDPPGQVLVIAFLACLTDGIIQGPSAGWRSVPVVAAFAVAAVAFALLIAWESRRTDPLIELRVFRNPAFSGAVVITVSAFACLGGFLFLTTLYLQDVRGLSAWGAGMALLPMAAGTAAAGPVAGRVLAIRGGRWPLAVAGVALAGSCLALAQFPVLAPWALLVVAYLAFGAGYGSMNAVIAAVAIAGMPRDQAGVAGGITSAGRQAGQSLGVAVIGSVFASGLHGGIGHGFPAASFPGARFPAASLPAASHPAWFVLSACGLVVTVLGLATTSRRPPVAVGSAPPSPASRAGSRAGSAHREAFHSR